MDLYLGLTLVCGFLYYINGMSVFDAISHAISTVAIGGFLMMKVSVSLIAYQ